MKLYNFTIFLNRFNLSLKNEEKSAIIKTSIAKKSIGVAAKLHRILASYGAIRA